MDSQDLNAYMALEAYMAREIGFEREKLRRMVDLLRTSQDEVLEKEKERSKLMGNKHEMLAKEDEKKKMGDKFMGFIVAMENNDLETAQNFNEKEMIAAIEKMMNSGGGGENGGFSGGMGNGDVLGTDMGLARVDEIVALVNGAGSFGCGNGGFNAAQGEINNAPENALNLGEVALMTSAAEEANSEGGEGI